jgi:ubiquitin carboxyl-terminal hydrolase 7
MSTSQWYEFDDATVREVFPANAIEKNFGGSPQEATAYVLIYIRQVDLPEIMKPVCDEEIPEHVRTSMRHSDDI